jgi:N-acetylglucosaminyldiphosphoundecaprenol N-acetyl-beta-D-mannosaminyltransferase
MLLLPLHLNGGPWRWFLAEQAGNLRDARSRVLIGNIDVDTLSFQGVLLRIRELVESRQGGSVFTPNVDHVMIAERDPALRAAYSRASLAIADGVPIVWASRLIGPAVPEKVSGSDLILPLMQLAAQQKWRVYFLGGADNVAVESSQLLAQKYGLIVAGVDTSRIGITPNADEPALVQRIVDARPDLLLVALGCPKQELFIDRNRDQLQATVSAGIGASLDFITGRVSRAPSWMSRVGLEWVYRLLQEPGRLWKRYLVQDTQFVFVLLRSLTRRRTQSA